MKNGMSRFTLVGVALISLLVTACGSDNSINSGDGSTMGSNDGTIDNSINSGDGSTMGSNDGTIGGSGDGFTGTLVDARDGQRYKTVRIGTQTWMAQNLNYSTGNSALGMTYTGKSVCYDLDVTYCGIYGQLYTWEDALTVCPQGWHLPSKEEFEDLLEFAKQNVGEGNAEYLHSTYLRDASWNDGLNSLGFSALPAGYRAGSFSLLFYSLGVGASFWSSTEFSGYYLSIRDDIAYVAQGSMTGAMSVRCLKD